MFLRLQADKNVFSIIYRETNALNVAETMFLPITSLCLKAIPIISH